MMVPGRPQLHPLGLYSMSELLVTTTSESHAPADIFAADRFLGPVRQVVRVSALVLIAIMILLPALQVVLREVLGIPFVGAEELTRFMLICVVFLTFPYVVASGANIRLEEVLLHLGRLPRRVVQILIAGTGVVVFGIGAAAIAMAAVNNLSNATPTLGIPYWVFFSAAFVGFLLSAFECGLQLWKVIRGLPLYVTFADEAPADDMSALEASLLAQADASIEGPRP
jgi:TRAP-type C4-dicarboxylate transport system permease small subunit